ncbi:hypothetical protein [Sinorhizobium alkalisoli]|uniref:hypothetical protein n=1 Tax=Sinorhizobium alkalisoli TaxID=1752398 RepID=UPI00124BEC17|nr:hypothetical protein [Sinorhizobium alkalisoli]QFI68954.1 hypothetical protein EKH55_4080 [Sinorhizobium alkalisoli]
MAQNRSLGSAVPRGVVDTKTGKVGVPEQSVEEQVRSLREQVNALKDTLTEMGLTSGRAVANTAVDASRRAGAMAREHPAWTALAVIGLVALVLAATARPYWPSRRSSRMEDIIATIEDRLADLKDRYWAGGWR